MFFVIAGRLAVFDAATACGSERAGLGKALAVRETDGRGGGAGRRASRISNPIARGWITSRSEAWQRRGKN